MDDLDISNEESFSEYEKKVSEDIKARGEGYEKARAGLHKSFFEYTTKLTELTDKKTSDAIISVVMYLLYEISMVNRVMDSHRASIKITQDFLPPLLKKLEELESRIKTLEALQATQP